MAKILSLTQAPASGADLVAACRAEMEAAGLSISRASREIGEGVSNGTLSRWLRGEYEGDIAAVEARIARWLETRAEAASRSLGGARLDRHAETEASADIAAALAYAQAVGDVVLIHGPSGRGKTWTARRHCEARTAAFYIQFTRSTRTLNGMLYRLAETVGAGAQHASAQDAETAIVERLQGRGALIVVDEAHHLRAALIDELRCIRDVAGCGLALIGDNSIHLTLAWCPQVVGRIGMRVDLKHQREEDVAAIAAGPLGRRPAKGELKALTGTARDAGGLHGLRRLLARAWMVAHADGRDRIEAADIAAAVEGAA